jgi:kynurenine 3-monooxygenase
MTDGPRVTVVGAGLAGLLMGVSLGRRGFRVSLFDKRLEAELLYESTAGRPDAATVTGRTVRSLEEVDLADSLRTVAIPLRGRSIRSEEERSVFQVFQTGDEGVYAIELRALRERLLNAARSMPHVHVSFNRKCILIDKASGTSCFEDQGTGHVLRIASDFIVGADGKASKCRQDSFRGEIAHFAQTRWDGGYRVRHLSAAEARVLHLSDDAINISGAKTAPELLWTLPHGDGSHTAFLIHRHVSPSGREPLTDGFAALSLIRPLTITARPWHFGRVVLIGEACHAEPPFFTSCVDEAFDDCRVLSHCIDRARGAFESAFAEYESIRYREVEALRKLSTLHCEDLWRHFQSPAFFHRRRIEWSCRRLFPTLLPIHELPAQVRMTHLEALSQYQRQQAIMRRTGLSVALTVAGHAAARWSLPLKGRGGAIGAAKRPLAAADFVNARAGGQNG